MFKTLALRGFRGFESYKLTDLAPVNLIAGKNNCGKTSVLEAVQLLASDGHTAALSEIVRRRRAGSYRRRVDISHLFFGHECRSGAQFELSSGDGERNVHAGILALDEVGEEAVLWDPRRVNVRRGEPEPDEDNDPESRAPLTMPEREASVLFVEGNDDLHAIKHLLLRHGVDCRQINVDIKRGAGDVDAGAGAGGVHRVLEAMHTAIMTSAGRSVGFVLDADEVAQDRWLRRAGICGLV